MQPWIIPAITLTLVLAAGAASAGPGGDGHGDDGHTDHAHGAGGFDSMELMTNESWSMTFTEAGVADYHCHPHPWMQGRITVLEAPANHTPMTHNVTIMEGDDWKAWDFADDNLTIMAGDTVNFVNTGAVMHRVSQTTAEHADHIAAMGGESGTATASVDDHFADGHSHEDGGGSNGLLWVLVALVGGVGIAYVVQQGKKQGK